MDDDATELEPLDPDPEPAVVSSAEGSQEHHSPSPDDGDDSHSAGSRIARGCGVVALFALAVVVVLVLVVSVASWTTMRAKADVPAVTGLRVPLAVQQITAAKLATATMGAVATSDFDSGVVVEQRPGSPAEVPVGTPVDLMVAVAPTPTVVPDLYLDSTPGAAARLEYGLLRPVLYRQLSDTVPFGRVVDQMPRAGQRVMTGQQVAVFISMGRGVGGAVVPSVLGKPLSEAATEVASAFLVALLFDPAPGQTLGGTVTDQVPAPGARVPIGSAVPVFTSTSAN
jgi:beta-lactam-binding protein with PASTA domain